MDFGWTSQPSGVAVISEGKLELVDRIADPDAILDWIQAHCTDAMVAVDAPTRIRNAKGMRLCEKQAHSRFGKYDAGCYPSNLGSVFAARTTGLGDALERAGFVHAPTIEAGNPGRYQIECFPHIACVQFFSLDRVIKYKKGLRAERYAELTRFRRLLQSLVETTLPDIPQTGNLKPVEDMLDAVLCALIGKWWWDYGLEKSDVLGDPEEGYIIAPHRL